MREYSYFDPKTRGLDFAGMVADLSAAPPGAVLLLHACAHNPTGVDPSPEQWRQLLALTQEKRLLPFFDSAYQVRVCVGDHKGERERECVCVCMSV